MSAAVAAEARRLLEDFFPAGVAVRTAPPEPEGGFLFPDEARSVTRAVPKRKREFALGRCLAREALAALSQPAAPIPVGSDRRPVWPSGWTGSITHTDALACAVVGPRGHVASLGVDAEGGDPIERPLEARICTARERAWLGSIPEARRGAWAKVVFSAKETIHKNVSPLFDAQLGFLDVRVELDSTAGGFVVVPEGEAAREIPWRAFRGAFFRVGRHVVTAGYFPAAIR